MPDPLIAYPVRPANATRTLRVTVDAVTEDLTFSATVDRNYWTVGDGQADASTFGGVGDLLQNLEACIDTHSGVTGSAVTLDSSFRVNVAGGIGTAAIELLWSHANTNLDATWFGWTSAADSGSAASVTAPNLPEGIWRPRRAAMDSRPRQPVVGGVSRALSGAVRVSRFATPELERDLDFIRVPQGYILDEYAAATEPYGALEYAWVNSISYGRPLRYYEDEDALTSSDYTLYKTRTLDEPYERDDYFKVRWNARLRLVGVTA